MAFLCLLLAACKKETASTTSQPSISGKWYQTKATEWQYINGIKSPMIDVTDYTQQYDYIQFNQDGTGVLATGDASSYTTVNFNYSVAGSILTVVYGSQSQIDTVSTLTQSSLLLKTQHQFVSGGINYQDFEDDYYSK
jgi:hypothetical protein